MGFIQYLSTIAVAFGLFSSSASALNVNSKTNLAVYWGQGAGQQRLGHFCQESALDIIPVGFINVFPEQGPAGWPGSNFGNQCDGNVYIVNGIHTLLLSGCYQIAEDIPICQAAGKTILLSLGGAIGQYEITSEQSAINFADFLWGAFGPKTAAWGTGPRPFGNAVVDGFDFAIELNGDYGYATMVNRFRELFKQDLSKKYYISAAPQCVIPDAHLSDAITNSVIDFVFVQFYNTMGCSARDWVSQGLLSGFSFDKWVVVIQKSVNPAAKLFIGLPASPDAALPGFYLTPDELTPLLKTYMENYPGTFGGVMLWEATASDNNQILGKSYADNVKGILEKLASALTTTTTTSTTAPTTTTTSTTTTTTSTPTTTPTTTSTLTTRSTTTTTTTTTPTATSTSTSTTKTSTTTTSTITTPLRCAHRKGCKSAVS